MIRASTHQHSRLPALLTAAVVASGLACSGGGGGGGGGVTPTTPPSGTATDPSASGDASGGPGTPPGASGSEAEFQTPAVRGVGARTINVPSGTQTTLQQAFNNAQPGDDIVMAGGTHSLNIGNVVLARSGTPTQWIRVTSAPGQTATIDLNNSGEFLLAGSYVLFENLRLIGGGGNNLHIAPINTTVSNVIIRGCTIEDLASGSGAAIKINRNNSANPPAGVERIFIENNDLSDPINNAIVDGVGVRIVVTRNNHIHNNSQDLPAIFFKGGSSKVLIENNLISNVRGNAALQIGGSTGPSFFDPKFPDREAVDTIVRNNIIMNCDDSCFEVRGALRAQVYHNTVVTQTTFAIFRLNVGNSTANTPSGNDDIYFGNNLIIATGGNPQYARNDGPNGAFTFGPQLWIGNFQNSGGSLGVPSNFPLSGDLALPFSMANNVVTNPSFTGVNSLAEAKKRVRLLATSPALNAGQQLTGELFDIIGQTRSTVSPSYGCYENP